MAQFYGELVSDRRRSNGSLVGKHQIGHKWLDATLYYGSSQESKQAVCVRINRPEATGKVTVWVDGEKVKELA